MLSVKYTKQIITNYIIDDNLFFDISLLCIILAISTRSNIFQILLSITYLLIFHYLYMRFEQNRKLQIIVIIAFLIVFLLSSPVLIRNEYPKILIFLAIQLIQLIVRTKPIPKLITITNWEIYGMVLFYNWIWDENPYISCVFMLHSYTHLSVYRMQFTLVVVLLLVGISCLLLPRKLGLLISHTLMTSFYSVHMLVYSVIHRNITYEDVNIHVYQTAVSVSEGYDIPQSAIFKLIIIILIYAGSVYAMIRWEVMKRRILPYQFIMLIYAGILMYTSDIFYRQAFYQEPVFYLVNSYLVAHTKEAKYAKEYTASYTNTVKNSNMNDDTSFTANNHDEAVTPNVIVILDESFYDFSVISKDSQLTESIPHTKDIMTQSIYSGHLYSAGLGGETATSEFELLTGISSGVTNRAGGLIYGSEMRDDLPSVMHVFHQMNYKTIGVHPYFSDGYNRQYAWNKLGFDETYFIDDMENPEFMENRFNIITDAYVFDLVKELEKEQEASAFIHVTTMQNHGGYAYPEVDTYCNLISMTDQAIYDLIEYYEDYDEPTIIVFLGDHPPSLYSFYKKTLGENYQVPDTEGYINTHKVPFFIWANYDTGYEKHINQEYSMNYIPAIILDLLDVDTDWYQDLSALKQDYPVITKSIFIDGNGHTECTGFSKKIDNIHSHDINSPEYRLKQYQVNAISYTNRNTD